jgi:hypothetical protein
MSIPHGLWNYAILDFGIWILDLIKDEALDNFGF